MHKPQYSPELVPDFLLLLELKKHMSWRKFATIEIELKTTYLEELKVLL